MAFFPLISVVCFLIAGTVLIFRDPSHSRSPGASVIFTISLALYCLSCISSFSSRRSLLKGVFVRVVENRNRKREEKKKKRPRPSLARGFSSKLEKGGGGELFLLLFRWAGKRGSLFCIREHKFVGIRSGRAG